MPPQDACERPRAVHAALEHARGATRWAWRPSRGLLLGHGPGPRRPVTLSTGSSGSQAQRSPASRPRIVSLASIRPPGRPISPASSVWPPTPRLQSPPAVARKGYITKFTPRDRLAGSIQRRRSPAQAQQQQQQRRDGISIKITEEAVLPVAQAPAVALAQAAAVAVAEAEVPAPAEEAREPLAVTEEGPVAQPAEG
jgi:hypothetical protein